MKRTFSGPATCILLKNKGPRLCNVSLLCCIHALQSACQANSLTATCGMGLWCKKIISTVRRCADWSTYVCTASHECCIVDLLPYLCVTKKKPITQRIHGMHTYAGACGAHQVSQNMPPHNQRSKDSGPSRNRPGSILYICIINHAGKEPEQRKRCS